MTSATPTLDDYIAEMTAAARDHGMAGALLAEPREWADTARTWIRLVASRGIEFSAETLQDAVGRAPSSGAAGAVLRKAAQANLIEVAGFTRSTRPSRRGGFQLVWRGRS